MILRIIICGMLPCADWDRLAMIAPSRCLKTGQNPARIWIPGRRRSAVLRALQKDNKEITSQIASYLAEDHSQIRFSSVFALGDVAMPPRSRLLKPFSSGMTLASRWRR